MSYRMIDALVTLHIQEIRHQAARHPGHRRAPRSGADAATPAGPETRAAPWRPAAPAGELAGSHPAGLRTRIGFALIEAGLRLSASGREPKPISR